MTHYEPHQVAKQKDQEAINAILELDEEKLLKRIDEFDISMCGYAPAVVMLVAAKKLGANWDHVHRAILADPLISNRYAQPIHKTGRGAGGGCFIKDIAALKLHVKKHLPEDTLAHAVLEAAEQKNIELLKSTDKDLDLLEGVYGAKIARKTAGKRGSKKRR